MAVAEREKYAAAGEASGKLQEQQGSAGQEADFFAQGATDSGAGRFHRTEQYTPGYRSPGASGSSGREIEESKGTETDWFLEEEKRSEEEQAGQLRKLLEQQEEQEQSFLEKLAGIATSSQESKGNFKMKSTGGEESVGQLAAMLSRAETRMDVQQVSSRAMRALTSLKMNYAVSSGDEAKKLAQQIRRMEKLIKRVQKKLRQLGKEEQLERQKKRAREKLQEQKEKEIKEELKSRRKKRRREERQYAMKEMARDGQSSAKETAESIAASMGAAGEVLPSGAEALGSSVTLRESGAISLDGGASLSVDLGGMDLGGADMAMPSVDITV